MLWLSGGGAARRRTPTILPGSGQGPQVLAVKPGRDEKAARDCLECMTAEQRQQVRSYRADMGATFHKACQALLENVQGVVDRFHVAQLWNDSPDRLRKKITRAHKAALSPAERKACRSRMWEVRRDPASLSEEERANLEELFTRIPELQPLHRLRTRFKEIFDTSPNRLRAAQALMDLFLEATEAFPELDGFVRTYEHWQEQILNYFERGQTSGAVEGIYNKARVITRRAYRIKSAQTLWTRLVLDLNRAGETVTHTIAALRALVHAFRTLFSPACA